MSHMIFFPDYETFMIIGNYMIPWTFITVILGTLVAYESVVAHMQEHGYYTKFADGIFPLVFAMGLIFGRIGWVIDHYQDYRLYAWEMLDLLDGGFDWITFYLGSLFGLFIYTRLNSLSFKRTADVVSIPLLCGFAVLMVGGSLSSVTASTYIIVNSLVILWLFFRYRSYKEGRKRGDVAAWLFLFLGMTRLGATLVTDGVISDYGFAECVAAEVIGLFLYLWNRRKKAVQPVILFDLDGTLMDSQSMVVDCFSHIYEKFGNIEDFTEDKKKYVFGPPLKTAMEKLFPDLDAEMLVSEYSSYQKSLMGTGKVKLLPKAEKTIRELKKNGYLIGVVSSRMTASCEQWLQELKVIQLFDVVLGRDETELPKPHPEGIFKACAILESSRDAIVYVGDTATDVMCARNACAFAVAYVSDPDREEEIRKEKPNVVITNLWELIDILKSEHEWTYKKI